MSGVGACIHNPSEWETETQEDHCILRASRDIQQIPGQPGYRSKTLSQNKNKTKQSSKET